MFPAFIIQFRLEQEIGQFVIIAGHDENIALLDYLAVAGSHDNVLLHRYHPEVGRGIVPRHGRERGDISLPWPLWATALSEHSADSADPR